MCASEPAPSRNALFPRGLECARPRSKQSLIRATFADLWLAGFRRRGRDEVFSLAISQVIFFAPRCDSIGRRGRPFNRREGAGCSTAGLNSTYAATATLGDFSGG